MAEPEPNKKMDELLQAYGKRPQPGVELHPASRRALQEEVKTVFKAPASRRSPSPFARWWLRWPLAAAFAVCALLLVLQNRRFEERTETDARSTPLAAANAPSISAGRLAAPRVAEGFGGYGAASDLLQDQSGQLEWFKNEAPHQAALDEFQVQRTGNKVLVKDSDGSVYAGAVVIQQSGANYSFAVHGVNHSLQQAVDFKGQLGAPPGAATIAGNGNINGQLQAQGRFVSGTATVGATNQLRIDAVSASKK